ncbi:MAG: hypothetical protein M1598_05220 [Actinobacteria bacterium]|nr:hypothetical protein [Actinomycetota bacterium]
MTTRRKRKVTARALAVLLAVLITAIQAIPAAFLSPLLGGVTTAEAAAPGSGRILSATGVAWGGVIAFNEDGSNAINLTSNTFDQGASAPDGRHKSSYPSVSGNGMIAFQSNRDGSGYRYRFGLPRLRDER